MSQVPKLPCGQRAVLYRARGLHVVVRVEARARPRGHGSHHGWLLNLHGRPRVLFGQFARLATHGQGGTPPLRGRHHLLPAAPLQRRAGHARWDQRPRWPWHDGCEASQGHGGNGHRDQPLAEQGVPRARHGRVLTRRLHGPRVPSRVRWQPGPRDRHGGGSPRPWRQRHVWPGPLGPPRRERHVGVRGRHPRHAGRAARATCLQAERRYGEPHRRHQNDAGVHRLLCQARPAPRDGGGPCHTRHAHQGVRAAGRRQRQGHALRPRHRRHPQ
mmetsp:Transcript_28727/g.84184  ORF Transcript_28727/g.84184 Transcript_28727/m.84184 type:complete len:272 (+) Transcript_28727:334-1149(+)